MEFEFHHTLRTVALGSGALGVVSGALGSFAVLRRQSLLGDAISHAALPGIALAFLLTGSKSPLVLLAGAAIAGWLATLVMMSILRTTRIKDDTALGTILSVFFGVGLVLLTFIQKMPDARQAGLDKFLFGQAATLLTRDVIQIASLGAGVLLLTALFWKEFKLLSFDPLFGASLGFPMRLIDGILTSLLVLAIVLGLQTVGVVLMSAMVVAPAAAARQWTDRLSFMVLLSAFFGAAAGVGGAIVSSTTQRLPTGPTIVLIATAFVIVSVLFAPHRGVVSTWIRHQRNRRTLQTDTVLGNMLILARQHVDATHGHAVSVIRAMSTDGSGVDRTLRDLELRGLVAKDEAGDWSLTQQGRREAEEDERQRTGAKDALH